MDYEKELEESLGRCPQCGEDEIDGGRCYYCGWPDHIRD